ncbi:unnamed protein product, partial [Prorocentrum cordatum]
MSPTLSFEQGIPLHDGTPGLLEEHLDRIDTSRVRTTKDAVKKTWPLDPRLYDAPGGEAYTAVKATNIDNMDLGTDSGLEAIAMALKFAMQVIGPNRVGELFDRTTQLSDNIEAYFLLKLNGLPKAQRPQLPASCGNVYDPKMLTEAIKVQFADLHEAE